MRAARERATRSGRPSRPAPGPPGQARLAEEAVAGTPPEHVVAGGLDPVEDRGAAEPGEPHLEAELRADEVAQGPAAREQRARARDQLRHQRMELRRHPSRVEVPLLDPEAVHQLAGRVDPALAEVE